MLIDKTKSNLSKGLPTIIHQVFILDESGSMSSMANEVISSFKTMIEALQKEESSLTQTSNLITLLTFSSDTSLHALDIPVSDFNPDINYVPSGMTALYDAIHHANKCIDDKLASYKQAVSHKVIVNIFTDGEENCSKECRDGTSVIKQMEMKDWIVNTFGIGLQGIASVDRLSASNRVRYNQAGGASVRNSLDTMTRSAVLFSKSVDRGAEVKGSDYLAPSNAAD
jgi:uncharacterized protein YegL